MKAIFHIFLSIMTFTVKTAKIILDIISASIVVTRNHLEI